MSARPIISALEGTGVAFKGVPWRDYTQNNTLAGQISVGFRGVPIMLIGPGSDPGPGSGEATHQYCNGLLMG